MLTKVALVPLFQDLLKCMGSSTYNLLSHLDIYNWHPEGTLNYLIVAKKKKVPPQANGDEGSLSWK